MVKAIKLLLILGLIFILAVSFLRHRLSRLLIEAATKHTTGLKLSIEDLNLNILNSSLNMRGITLFNPPGFRNEVLGSASEIFIKYDLLGSLAGGLHLRLVKAEIDEIKIIRNEKGSSNISSFKRARPKAKSSKDTLLSSSARKENKASKRKKRPKFLINRLEISLEKVTFLNYSAMIGQPAAIIFTSEGPFVFTNVSDFGYVIDTMSEKEKFRNLLNNLVRILPTESIKDSVKATTEAIKNKVIFPKSE